MVTVVQATDSTTEETVLASGRAEALRRCCLPAHLHACECRTERDADRAHGVRVYWMLSPVGRYGGRPCRAPPSTLDFIQVYYKVALWPLWRPRKSLSSFWLAAMAARNFGCGRHGGQHVCRPASHKTCYIGARPSGPHGGHAARVMRPPQALVRRCPNYRLLCRLLFEHTPASLATSKPLAPAHRSISSMGILSHTVFSAFQGRS